MAEQARGGGVTQQSDWPGNFLALVTLVLHYNQTRPHDTGPSVLSPYFADICRSSTWWVGCLRPGIFICWLIP